MEQTKQPQPLKLLLTIVDKGRGKAVLAGLDELGVRYHLVGLGRGAAKSELLKYLGLGETEKDVIISAGAADQVTLALTRLNEEFHFDRPGHGIAFTLPVNGISSRAALDYITEETVK